eukprot:403333267
MTEKLIGLKHPNNQIEQIVFSAEKYQQIVSTENIQSKAIHQTVSSVNNESIITDSTHVQQSLNQNDIETHQFTAFIKDLAKYANIEFEDTLILQNQNGWMVTKLNNVRDGDVYEIVNKPKESALPLTSQQAPLQNNSLIAKLPQLPNALPILQKAQIINSEYQQQQYPINYIPQINPNLMNLNMNSNLNNGKFPSSKKNQRLTRNAAAKLKNNNLQIQEQMMHQQFMMKNMGLNPQQGLQQVNMNQIHPAQKDVVNAWNILFANNSNNSPQNSQNNGNSSSCGSTSNAVPYLNIASNNPLIQQKYIKNARNLMNSSQKTTSLTKTTAKTSRSKKIGRPRKNKAGCAPINLLVKSQTTSETQQSQKNKQTLIVSPSPYNLMKNNIFAQKKTVFSKKLNVSKTPKTLKRLRRNYDNYDSDYQAPVDEVHIIEKTDVQIKTRNSEPVNNGRDSLQVQNNINQINPNQQTQNQDQQLPNKRLQKISNKKKIKNKKLNNPLLNMAAGKVRVVNRALKTAKAGNQVSDDVFAKMDWDNKIRNIQQQTKNEDFQNKIFQIEKDLQEQQTQSSQENIPKLNNEQLNYMKDFERIFAKSNEELINNVKELAQQNNFSLMVQNNADNCENVISLRCPEVNCKFSVDYEKVKNSDIYTINGGLLSHNHSLSQSTYLSSARTQRLSNKALNEKQPQLQSTTIQQEILQMQKVMQSEQIYDADSELVIESQNRNNQDLTLTSKTLTKNQIEDNKNEGFRDKRESDQYEIIRENNAAIEDNFLMRDNMVDMIDNNISNIILD